MRGDTSRTRIIPVSNWPVPIAFIKNMLRLTKSQRARVRDASIHDDFFVSDQLASVPL